MSQAQRSLSQRLMPTMTCDAGRIECSLWIPTKRVVCSRATPRPCPAALCSTAIYAPHSHSRSHRKPGTRKISLLPNSLFREGRMAMVDTVSG